MYTQSCVYFQKLFKKLILQTQFWILCKNSHSVNAHFQYLRNRQCLRKSLNQNAAYESVQTRHK